jgi:SAM-dependent methyltransferase
MTPEQSNTPAAQGETAGDGADGPLGTGPDVVNFAARVYGDICSTMATLLAAIGDRLGLFRALAEGGPATSEELAARAGIDERYAREWLGGMAAAGYMHFDAATERYALTPEQVTVLAEAQSPFFMGGSHQMLLGLLRVCDQVTNAFKTGGGVPQSAYGEDVWEGMVRGNAGWIEHVLVQGMLPDLPDVRARLEGGANLADVGCGRGGAILKLAQSFPAARFVGYDAFAPTVAGANERAQALGIADRVHFEVRDGTQGLPERYDVITTFDVIHDAANPPALLRAIHAALQPDGIYVCFEPASAEHQEERVGPRPTFLYGASLLYCMTTSLSQHGAGLGALGMSEPVARELLREAGFSSVRRVPLKDALGEPDTFHSVFEARP